MFEQQTVVVTGAAQGIGKSVAAAFKEKGARVIGVDIEKGQDERIDYRICDVRDFRQVEKTFAAIHEDCGDVNVLINNAGVSDFKAIWEVSEADWDHVIDTNLKSVFICSREAARYMKGGLRSIVNIASTRAFMSEPGTESYSASKGGVFALTHSLAASLHELGIRVNSVAPGWIHTGEEQGELRDIDHSQHWSGRVGKGTDIAKACLFLSAPDNDFMTGECLTIDGGMTRKMIYEQ